nr:protein zyg 11 B [Hymenolepis microstoma]
MEGQVSSLQELCYDYILKNFKLLVVKIPEPNGKSKCVWRYFPPNRQIPTSVGKKLLARMRLYGLFNMERMKLFSKDYVNMGTLEIRNFPITSSTAHFLQDFTPYELTLSHIYGATLEDLIASLNDHACEVLESLDISGVHIFKDKMPSSQIVPAVGELGRLSNLRSLNISDTGLRSSELAIVVEKCPNLEYLDISDNQVEDISCLLKLKDKLEGLILHFPRIPEEGIFREAVSTILQLEKLQELELSTFEQQRYHLSTVKTLLSPGTFIHLQHFDVSGNPLNLNSAELRTFIENHPNLKFLGLAHWPESRTAYDISLEYPYITMAGDLCESMLIEALRRYWKRCRYLEATLRKIVGLMSRGHIFSVNILEAVLDATEEIITTKTYKSIYLTTVFYLLKRLQLDDLSNNLLNRVMKFTLDAMYQNHARYSLLRILMDKYKVMPDGTYRNVESKLPYILNLMRYIEDMWLSRTQMDKNPQQSATKVDSASLDPARYSHFSIPILRIFDVYSQSGKNISFMTRDSWLHYLCLRLYSPSFEMSYLAAKLLCTITVIHNRRRSNWNFVDMDDVLECLGTRIRHWRPPFEIPPQHVPSLSLLENFISNPKSSLEVKLWALWSLRNVVPEGSFTKQVIRRHPQLKMFLMYALSSLPENLLFFPEVSTSPPNSNIKRFLSRNIAEVQVRRYRDLDNSQFPPSRISTTLKVIPRKRDTDVLSNSETEVPKERLSDLHIYMQEQHKCALEVKSLTAEMMASLSEQI